MVVFQGVKAVPISLSMTDSMQTQAQHFLVTDDHDGQRLDNFLMAACRGVPRSHIYRVIRSGEVRINRARARADTRVVKGDKVRLPPMRLPQPVHRSATVPGRSFPVVFENEAVLIVDKPSGTAVHGGSGVSHGVIEQLRAKAQTPGFLELAHRLDRDTSGLLVLAKSRKSLLALQADLQAGRWEKRYLALVIGDWVNDRQHIRLPLRKSLDARGERQVRVDEQHGVAAHTVVELKERFNGRYSLVEAQLKTGRTHQIRVHLSASGFPIAGDEKYGDFTLNRNLAKEGLGRMFLHAHTLVLNLPGVPDRVKLTAPLPSACENYLANLRQTLLESR